MGETPTPRTPSILPAKRDLLVPCPGCCEVRKADAGHHLCRQCEGYSPTESSPLMSETPTPRTIEQTYIDATRDDRWWRYGILPDYSLRERACYTACEVAFRASDGAQRLASLAEEAGHRLRDWGSR